MTSQYHALKITASSPDTEIWLADCDGHLVQKAEGALVTSLLAGEYVVEFKLGGTNYPISLNDPATLTEAEIRSGSSCPRPEVRLL